LSSFAREDVCGEVPPAIDRYSITLSARTRKISEIVRPSAFAIFRFTTSREIRADERA
jgi:hypothetical protein